MFDVFWGLQEGEKGLWIGPTGLIYPYAAYSDSSEHQPLSDSRIPDFLEAVKEATFYGCEYNDTSVTNEDNVDSAYQPTYEDLESRFNKTRFTQPNLSYSASHSNNGNWVKDVREDDCYCPKCEGNLNCEAQLHRDQTDWKWMWDKLQYLERYQ
ncbi:hypothetical protein ACET3Z_005342 [Daucus carota]